MLPLTWPSAIAFIGSIATVCVSIITILKMRNSNSKDRNEDSNEIAALKQANAVQTEQISELKESYLRLQANFDKLNNLLIQLLTN